MCKPFPKRARASSGVRNASTKFSRSTHLLSHLLLLLLEAHRDALAEGHELLDTTLDTLLLGSLQSLGSEAGHALVEAALNQVVVGVHGLGHLHLVQLCHHRMLVPLRQALDASHHVLRCRHDEEVSRAGCSRASKTAEGAAEP